MNYAFARIKQLRALAGSISSYSNANNAAEHMNIIGRAKVYYKLIQNTGDASKKPGVYITDLDLADFSDKDAGLYKVDKIRDQNRWDLDSERKAKITSNFAAINGMCRDIQQAAEDIVPHLLKDAYSDKQYAGNLEQEGYNLFYNPPSLYDRGKKWKSPQQKRVTKEVTTQRLASALKERQSRKQPVQWVVHGDGAKVLHQASLQLNGADLSQHTLMFMAPTHAIADILPLARRSNMKLHDAVMKIHDDDWLSKKAQFGTGAKLATELAKVDGFEKRGLLLKSSVRDSSVGAASGLWGAALFGAGVGTFLMAPAIPALTTVGAVGAAFGGYDSIKKAQSMRNIAANTVKNPAFNPHLNPHKSVAELNLDARLASGSLAKTFADVVKARLKG